MVRGSHTIFWNDGTNEPCFCSHGADHNEDEGNWDLIDDEDEDEES
jgi:hypothetical protein